MGYLKVFLLCCCLYDTIWGAALMVELFKEMELLVLVWVWVLLWPCIDLGQGIKERKASRNFLLRIEYKIGLHELFEAPSHWATGIMFSKVGGSTSIFAIRKITYNGSHETRNVRVTQVNIFITPCLVFLWTLLIAAGDADSWGTFLLATCNQINPLLRMTRTSGRA